MSDNNLRLQVILNAVDKLTRPFRAAQASSKELAGAIRNSRDALKQLNQAGNSLEKFRKLQADNKKLGDRLNYARQKANLLSSELEAMEQPSQRHLVALGRQTLAVQRLEEQQKYLQKQTALVRAELYRAGISAKDDAGATARLARETSRYNQELSKQEARLKRLGEAQRRMNAARASYARSLEVRDRIAGAGATTTAAGLAMGTPVMAAVKSYTSMEDAMKGVAKQVNGLRDDNGNRTARFYEMQDAIKAASEQLPMENGAVDFAALVEGGARMNVANPDDSWEDQKRDLLAFASTAAKAATAFELPADELSESLGKIAQLYKIPTRNIEQLGDALNYLDDNAMSKGADIIDVMQRLGGVADRLDYRKAAALGSTFLTLGAAPEVAASAANAMVRELSIATMQSKSFFEGMNLLKLNPEMIEKQMSGLLGALLSPIGLVVTALAGVALVVWKYWQPITAFLGGVVEGFKAAAGPVSAAFEPLKPVFQWIGDKVQALWGRFTDLLTPVKSTSAELQSAAAMGRRFGEALAEGLNMVMHPLDSLKSGVSWLLEKLGIVSKEAAKAKLPESVTRQQPATVNADGKVMMPSGGFPSWGYGFAGMYDSGGYIPRGQFGIVGENGPEIVNGPANVTSRRNTAALAAVVAGMMGVAAAPAELPPLHPLALPAKGGEAMVSRAATVPPVQRIEAPTQIIIQTQPGQSAQDIAREVARQLDERERRLKAKARSNYSDQGGYDA
ncbi:phage tail tape measure protein [Escherichia coli]|uniref:phage tail tape measure protein n=1 Tax=Escherichia coli TaxID=562 RepID=UPI0007E4E45F|nr:phage tail tape measure protein [Escherichia coli]